MIIRNIFSVILICFFFCQCKTKEYTYEYYENKPDQIKVKSEVVDGFKDGIEEVYSLEGKVLEIHNYKKGDRIGMSSFYKKDGHLYLQLSYANNVKNGPYRFYFPNGNIQESGNIVNNNKRGKVFKYFESDSGRVKLEIYALDWNDMENDYYRKSFDAKGNLMTNWRDLNIEIPDDTLKLGVPVNITFQLDKKYEKLDSVIIVVGDFDNPTYNSDTIEMSNLEAQYSFVPKEKGLYPLKGYCLMYRSKLTADSLIEITRYQLFEEFVFIK